MLIDCARARPAMGCWTPLEPIASGWFQAFGDGEPGRQVRGVPFSGRSPRGFPGADEVPLNGGLVEVEPESRGVAEGEIAILEVRLGGDDVAEVQRRDHRPPREGDPLRVETAGLETARNP
jgi:hypothetical protein